MTHLGMTLRGKAEDKKLSRDNYVDKTTKSCLVQFALPGCSDLRGNKIPEAEALVKLVRDTEPSDAWRISDEALRSGRYYLGYALTRNLRKFSVDEAMSVYWEYEGQYIADLNMSPKHNIRELYFANPYLWHACDNYEQVFGKQMDSPAFRKSAIMMHLAPYPIPEMIDRLEKRALRNFDLNMRYFSHISKADFEAAVNEILQHNLHGQPFIETASLTDYVGVPGFYIMILVGYRQMYAGVTRSVSGIAGRIQQHWNAKVPLDRLVFGGETESILSIDSFRALDTTRVIVCPMTGVDMSDDAWQAAEAWLTDEIIPQRFLLNRCSGGGLSFSDAVVTQRTRNLEKKGDETQ